jgi:hypothetical protein
MTPAIAPARPFYGIPGGGRERLGKLKLAGPIGGLLGPRGQ